MRFVVGNPSIDTHAMWYFAAKTALPFPTPHAFDSANWNTVHPTRSLLGDQDQARRRYYNGRRLNISDGTSFAGPLAFFQNGCPAIGDLPRGPGNTPLVCIRPGGGIFKSGTLLPTNPAIGGVDKGGSSYRPISPGLPCNNCSAETPAALLVTITGALGPAAVFNGVWTCPQDIGFNCSWSLTVAPGHTIDIIRQGSLPLVRYNASLTGPGNAAYVQVSGVQPDCTVTVTVLASGSTMIGSPPFITIGAA
jgi:hypothetical protein